MKRFWLAVGLLLLGLSGCGPKIEDLEKGERGRVETIRDGDTLVLEDGLVVHLANLEAPRRDQPHAKDARAALERLALHRTAQLAYGGPAKRAREAAIAHVFVQTEGARWIWLQEAMLREGHARVRTRPDNTSRVEEMLLAETAARAGKKGIWAEEFFQVRKAPSLSRDPGAAELDPACLPAPEDTAAERQGEDDEQARERRPRRVRDFLLVEGQIESVAARERAVFLNFGPDIQRDFAIMVPRDRLEAWPNGEAELTALKGKTVLVRGFVPRCSKPLMRADHPAQIVLKK